jgi:transposase
MSKPERRDPEKEAFWRSTIHDYRKSGLGQTEYCRQHGLNVNSLNAWIRIIKSRDEERRVGNSRRRKKDEEPYWSFVLDDWQQSGLTLKEFARGRRLKYQSLCYWKAKILPDVSDDEVVSAGSGQLAADSFIPVRVIEPSEEPARGKPARAVTQQSDSLEIVLRCGRVIRLSSHCEPAFLIAVISAIEAC